MSCICTKGNERPTHKELNRFLTDYCEQWNAIGLHLDLKRSVLKTIAKDNPMNERECFRVTLDRWLELDADATWSTLELAITNAKREKMGLDPLDTSKIYRYNGCISIFAYTYIYCLLRGQDQIKNCIVFSILQQVCCMENTVQWLANTSQLTVQSCQESNQGRDYHRSRKQHKLSVNNSNVILCVI